MSMPRTLRRLAASHARRYAKVAPQRELKREVQRELAAVREKLADVGGQLADVRGELADVRGELADVKGVVLRHSVGDSRLLKARACLWVARDAGEGAGAAWLVIQGYASRLRDQKPRSGQDDAELRLLESASRRDIRQRNLRAHPEKDTEELLDRLLACDAGLRLGNNSAEETVMSPALDAVLGRLGDGVEPLLKRLAKAGGGKWPATTAQADRHPTLKAPTLEAPTLEAP